MISFCLALAFSLNTTALHYIFVARKEKCPQAKCLDNTNTYEYV